MLATQLPGKRSYLNDPELLHVPLPGAAGPGKHMVAAKDSAAARMLPRFNAALADMIQSGEYDSLWKKDIGDLPL